MEDKSPKTKSKKRKIVSDYKSSSTSSLNEVVVCHKKKSSKCEESEYKKTCQKKSVENKKLETSLKQDNKYSDEKSPGKTKREYNKFINQEKDEDKQIELEIWYYLLHHLEESEKLIVLKLLVGINKMKKSWQENFIKNKYVDKKAVDDMKLVIKGLQDEQEKNEAEKQKLIQEKNELQKKIREERQCRIKLAETLVSQIETNNLLLKKQTNQVPNNIEASNKVEDKQTITEIVSTKEPSTSKTSSNDGNNNTRVSKVKGDKKKEVDLRDILNNREIGGTREPHVNRLPQENLIPPPFIRRFPPFKPYPHSAKRTANFHDRLYVNIKTPIRHFPEVKRIIDARLGIPMRFSKVTSLNDGWRVEFHSFNAKIDFLNRKKQFIGTELFVINSF